jgi:hypothetical protein
MTIVACASFTRFCKTESNFSITARFPALSHFFKQINGFPDFYPIWYEFTCIDILEALVTTFHYSLFLKYEHKSGAIFAASKIHNQAFYEAFKVM